MALHSSSDAPAGAAVQAAMREGAWTGPAGTAGRDNELTVGPEPVEVLHLEGAGVIRRLKLSNPRDSSDPLPGLSLRIYWDGTALPAVDTPVDAFFLNRFDLKDEWPGGAGLKTFFITASTSGYEAAFPMPFANGARLELASTGAEKTVRVEVRYDQLALLPEGAMRFHAAYAEREYETDWSEDTVITTNTPIDPASNYVVLEREGQGHYLGCGLFVASVGRLWWGEGDENTYIDGAKAPQIQGTGTEDEFNWSWGFNANMSMISGTLPRVPPCEENVMAQLVPALRNPECNDLIGHNAAYRFRVSDYVPFARSLKVSYEIIGAAWATPHGFITGNWSQHRGDDYASIAYWYERP
jgi:hypothetical protein